MRTRRLVLVALAGLLAAATVLAVALNAATGGHATWFPSMDRHPLWWVAGGTVAVATAGLMIWRAQDWYDHQLTELVPIARRTDPWIIDRPDEVNQVVTALRNSGEGTVGITTAGQRRQPQPIGWPVADPADLASLHRVLVPEHQQPGVFGRLAPGQHQQTAEHIARAGRRPARSVADTSARKTPSAWSDRVIEPHRFNSGREPVGLNLFLSTTPGGILKPAAEAV